jgi:uncharacterized membrane protein YkvA (DUF1232 family)
MDEVTHLPEIHGSQLDPASEFDEASKMTLKQRAIYCVKELGFFVRLFFSLLLDERVEGKVKIFVGAVLAYVISPVDFIPELFSGLFGMLDDFVLSAFALNVLLNWVDPEIIKSHWKGKSDLLVTVQRAMKNAELLVPDAVLKKIEGWIGRHVAKLVPTSTAPTKHRNE